MLQVTYRCEGDQLRFVCDAVKLRMGGFWLSAANRIVTPSQFEQLQRENPDVEFIADESINWRERPARQVGAPALS